MTRTLLAALAALLALAGCDFTPTLDIPLPEFEPGLTVNGVLAADSTVTLQITAAADPYLDDDRYDRVFVVPDGVAAELLSGGARLSALRLVSERCPVRASYFTPDTAPETYECGAFVSDVVVEPGRTYTVRVSAPGFPDAQATVTVPARVAATAKASASTERALAPDGVRRDTDLTLTFRDPAGLGQRYGLMVLREPFIYTYDASVCDDRTGASCRDTTVTERVDPAFVGYTTSDPVLLAGARVVPATGIDFISFDDETFDGEQRTFAVRAQQFWYPSYRSELGSVIGAWIIAADATTFDAHQIAWFSGGEDSPFTEPIDLPSNVVGGYGLLGAVTITEALIAP